MLLSVKDLNKSFEGKQVLKDISFQLNEGEIMCILGSSGAGKTTLLRCINGLETCDSGIIEVEETPLYINIKAKNKSNKYVKNKEVSRKLGMVFQSFNLFPHMNVLENIIEAPIKVLKISRKEAEKRANNLLISLGLGEKRKSYPYQLSGGEKQRVAIARACAMEPKIMCFDEPTSALDPELTNSIAKIIKDLARNNMAVLIITHDMNFAKKVGDKIIFVKDGMITKIVSSEEFFKEYQVS